MQSEMEKIFGASAISARRFSKAKSCTDVLSSYQFRLGRLRSDLQVMIKRFDCDKLLNEMMG